MEKVKKRTEQQQAEFASAQIICKPPNGGNHSPEMKALA